ncbi:MAG: hypothetical protein AABW79_03975 [Nanoarchaeota archaeon]
MNLDIGTNERFLEYVNGVSKEDNVALVSHIDLDGLASAFIANKFFKTENIYFVNYDELNLDLAEELREKGITKVVFTDLFLGHDNGLLEALESFAEVLVLDHHMVPSDKNSPRTVYLKCENGYCAAYFCYEMFSEVMDLSSCDWIVACACISDFCYEKNSEWMIKTFDNYGQKFSSLTLRQSSFWSLQWTLSLALVYFKDNIKRVYDSIGNNFGEIGNIKPFAEKVQDELDILLKRFVSERRKIPGGWYWEFSPHFKVGGLVSSIVSGSEQDKTYILVRNEGMYCFVSARRQNMAQSMVDLLQSALKDLENASAGGHIPAAGGHFMKRDLEVVRKRLGVAE